MNFTQNPNNIGFPSLFPAESGKSNERRMFPDGAGYYKIRFID